MTFKLFKSKPFFSSSLKKQQCIQTGHFTSIYRMLYMYMNDTATFSELLFPWSFFPFVQSQSIEMPVCCHINNNALCDKVKSSNITMEEQSKRTITPEMILTYVNH